MLVRVFSTVYSTSGYPFVFSGHRASTNAYIIFTHGVCIELGPCHHGMARPQVGNGGTASNMGGSCEYF